MSMRIGGTDEYNSEINVTPMVDVMLVLLIIFMIVTPLLQQGVSVALPRGDSSEQDDEITKDTSVVIALADNSNFYIGKQQFPLNALSEQIQSKMKDKTGDKRIVYIKADSSKVSYGTVVKAIDTIRKQDIDKVGLVADKKKTGQPAS